MNGILLVPAVQLYQPAPAISLRPPHPAPTGSSGSLLADPAALPPGRPFCFFWAFLGFGLDVGPREMRLSSPFSAKEALVWNSRACQRWFLANRYFDLQGKSTNMGIFSFLFLSGICSFFYHDNWKAQAFQFRVWLARLLNCSLSTDPILWFAFSPSSAFTRRHLNTLEMH